MTINNKRISAALLISGLFSTPAVFAGEITGVSVPAVFPIIASISGATVNSPALNNDDVVGDSPNEVFVLDEDFAEIGQADLVFSVIPSGGVTEYAINEHVLNNSGFNWGAFRVELGFGFGPGFVKSTAADGLDFDAPFFNSTIDFNPTLSFFPDVAIVSEDEIFADGGTMSISSSAQNFVFHIDVPDGITSFTLRHTPLPGVSSVPVPAAVWLFGSGLLGLASIARRKKT